MTNRSTTPGTINCPSGEACLDAVACETHNGCARTLPSAVDAEIAAPNLRAPRSLSDFIRNGTPQEKEAVYTEVMEKASERQRSSGDFTAARIDYIESRAKSGATAPTREELAGFHDGWHAAQSQRSSTADAKPSFVDAVYSAVRLAAEGSGDWKRDQGEPLAEWVTRRLKRSSIEAPKCPRCGHPDRILSDSDLF